MMSGLWLAAMLLMQSGPVSATPAPSTEISSLQKAAEAGDTEAEFRLGKAFDDGNGVAQNDSAAFSWYQKAAEQGSAQAQNAVGLMYRTGRGVEQSKELAAEWYRKAARQKNAKAMFNLGTAYYNGDGVAVDDVSAYAWFVLAEQSGSEPAHDALNRTARSLLTWQVSLAFEKIGDMYQKGNELPQDDQAALDWYRKAAKLGDPEANVKFARFLMILGGEKNYQEALHSCAESGKKLYSPGALCAGYLYQKGLGTSQNLAEAAKWFARGAQLGNAQAMLLLGEMYWDGAGVKQNRITAYALVLLASTAELPQAALDKAAYEKVLNAGELEKGRKEAEEWARTHHPLGLKVRTSPPE